MTPSQKIKEFKSAEMTARFLAMGILPGDELQVLGRAPLRGALRVRVESGVFALRQVEFEAIVFESVDLDPKENGV